MIWYLIKRFALRFAQRAVRVHRQLVPQPLTNSERMFIKENASFWSKYAGRDEGYVLVEYQQHPIIYLSDASFAAIVGYARNLRPLFILPSSAKSSQRQILASYPNAAFAILGGWQFLVSRIWALVEAAKMYRSIKSPEELLHLKIDGQPVGHTIYDAVLVTYGFATVEKIDKKVFSILYDFFVIRFTVKHILRSYRVDSAVISQFMGLWSATLAQHLFADDIEVLNRVGSHQLCLMKFRSLDDMVHHTPIPLREHFDAILKERGDEIVSLAEAYLEKRFGGGIARIDAEEAFDTGKLVFNDSESFCKRYGLDSKKPLVFVMLHQFNDWPHWNYPKTMIFRDYYHWLLATLEIASRVDSVNWVFKEHPGAKYYPTHDLDVGNEVAKVAGDHILLLDGEADFNTGSLRHIAHAIVTGMGTAGLEFSGYGVPSVLASDCYYSDFGFTIQPETAEDYESCLEDIHRLAPLSFEQRRVAKSLAFFYFRVSEGNAYHFCPRFEDQQISEWWERDYAELLWQRAASNFKDCTMRMKDQVEDLSEFLLDESRIQYYDQKRFGFMRVVSSSTGD